ncbi:hypothetical protein, partial [Rhizobium sp.]|uniref:hypothetical protein n=1 Tax=Rhizobium sp. TaxID=391 RepID=UPI0028AC2DAD
VNRYSTPCSSIPVESNISGRRCKKRYVRKSLFAMYDGYRYPFLTIIIRPGLTIPTLNDRPCAWLPCAAGQGRYKTIA